MNKIVRPLTNDIEKYRNKNFDATFGSIFRNSKCCQRNKQKRFKYPFFFFTKQLKNLTPFEHAQNLTVLQKIFIWWPNPFKAYQ